jgi:predicted membrane protein
MKTTNINSGNSSSRLWSGLILLVIGLVFFLRNFGIDIPDWVLSWHTLLIAIGLFIGFKRNFRGGAWLIFVLVGAYFTIEDMGDFDFSRYYFALIFIALGLYLILKPKSSSIERWKLKNSVEGSPENPLTVDPAAEATVIDQNDIIDSVNVFGGANQKVFSKNLRGGDVVAIFGGCELNLSHSDFQDTITLEVVAIFGGIKIIVPPTWEIKSEVAAIFGGIDDKRAVAPFGDGPRKILVIKGLALFGGVDIKNY